MIVLMRLPWPKCLSLTRNRWKRFTCLRLKSILSNGLRVSESVCRVTLPDERSESKPSSTVIFRAFVRHSLLHGPSQARAFLRARFNPFAVVRDGEKAFVTFLSKAASRDKISPAESHQIFQACQAVANVCRAAERATTINEEFFVELQDEIARELRLMETEEVESESIESRISEIYHKLHPSNNLCSIPGVGEHTAPIFLATIGDPARFRNQSAFANWTGVVPRSRQSSNMEAKGLRMTKAGPSIMRMALFQSGDIGRRWDPQMAAIYYRQMVFHGKNHKQAIGAVMSHLGARVLKVLLEDRPYELRDMDGKSVTRDYARRLILTKYHVSEDIRKERRRRNSKIGKTRETATNRTNEAAKAPQPV